MNVEERGTTEKNLLIGESNLQINVCCKCRENPAVVSARNNKYCKECFLRGTEHRFRTHFLKIGAPKNPQVLLALSGGESSACLVELFTPFSKCSSNPKKPSQYPSVLICHIDQSCIFGEKVSGLEEKVRHFASSYDLPFISVKMEDILFRNSKYSVFNFEKKSIECMENVNLKRSDLLKKSIFNFESLSYQEDLFHILTMRSLLLTARLNNCNVIMLGDNATQLGIKAISLTSRGRGVNMAHYMDLVSHVSIDEFEPITLIRPLRDTLLSEIRLFNELKSIQLHLNPTITDFPPGNSSIDRLTSKFILDLQAEMSSTVSIITKTAFKIHSNADIIISENICKLCRGFVDVETIPGQSNIESNMLCYACKKLIIICEILPCLD